MRALQSILLIGGKQSPIIFPKYALEIFYIVLFIITSIPVTHAQDSLYTTHKRARIDILNSDDLFIERDAVEKKDWHRLIGNVHILHKETHMYCDSAHFYPGRNDVYAYSNIHIEQGDTLHIYGDELYFDGTTELATLKGNAKLRNKEVELYSDNVFYDIKAKKAIYVDGGTIINGDNTLSSIIGVYYTALDRFHFKDSISIVNPDYTINADTMDYYTKTEIVSFQGPSTVKGDSLFLYCEQGWCDTKNRKMNIRKNASIDNKHQIIKGDSLYYDELTGYGESFGNVNIIDTLNKLALTSNYAWYYKSPERFLATDSAMFIKFSKNDSLFLHADTISSTVVTDTLNGDYRLLKAYHGCKIFSNDFQAKCDSIIYSFQDSVIRMYDMPVIWSDANQLTADSIALFTKNNKADKMLLYNTAFVAGRVDFKRFNQIKGRLLTGYFKDNKLDKININGNGETIYYIVDKDLVIGINNAKSSTIDIFFENQKIKNIIQSEPTGDIDPPLSSDKDYRLEGFIWLDNIRPKQMPDIFK